ncbi:MAG: choice-of-anchor D domain-containing protein [Acidobacteriaceae bacterium]|nr:choice-of-anchor D domain-containing protein [Acidobacteriaceae bacterium]
MSVHRPSTIFSSGVRALGVAVFLSSLALGTGTAPASQDFGQSAVNATVPVSLAYSFVGLTTPPAFSLVYGADFQLAAPNCTGSLPVSCSIQVTFAPHHPGLLLDGVLATDQSGNILAATILHGIGQAPQIAVFPGILTTFAGTGQVGYSGNNGPAVEASFFDPTGLALDPSGNLYIADSVNQVVRRVDHATGVITIVAGNGHAGYAGDGGSATQASLQTPMGLAFDGAGDLYIADQGNNRIRKVTAAGIISTVAGGGAAASQVDELGDGGPATGALLSGPSDVAVDVNGNLYIADSFHGLVREVNASTGIITVFAGGGGGGGSDGWGDGGQATNATLSDPSGLALDANENLYIADSGHSLVRKVSTGSGIITAVAGSGAYGYSGDSGVATNAELSKPVAIRVDAAGNIYIADQAINFLREVQAADGVITTLSAVASGSAALAGPGGLALDSSGNIYASSAGNNTVVKLSPVLQPIVFGTENVGQASSPFVVTAQNVGNQPLSFSSVTVTSGFALQPSGYIDCAAGVPVAAGSSCILAVALAPLSAGPVSGTLTIAGNSLSAGTETAALTGTGAGGPVPQVVVTPATLSFGNQMVGSTSTAATVTLSNTGTAPLSIFGSSLSGPNAPEFTVSSTTCSNSVPAGSNCTFSITFSPTAGGLQTASLAITDSVASSPQTVALTGTGYLTPIASLSQASLTFPAQNVGSVSASQTVTLTNTGNAALVLTGVSVSGANASDFAAANNCPGTLAPGASCGASIVFAPKATGNRNAVLLFADSAAGSPQQVTLSGTGVAPPQVASSPHVSLTATSLSFNGHTTQTLTVTNTGTATLNLQSVQIGSGTGSGFQVTGGSCGLQPQSLPPNTNCSIAVTFTPPDPGGEHDTIVLTDDAADSPQVVHLAGAPSPAGAIPLLFVPITPCRVADTRNPTGPFGGPKLGGGASRDFAIPKSSCGVPSAAAAYSLNVTVVPDGALGFLSIWPSGQPQPFVSTLNSDGRVKANAAIVPAGANGAVSVYVSDPSHVVLDINGYFVSGNASALAFFPLTPCRVADTRQSGGALGSGESRDFAITASACSVPAAAQAYSLNFTVIPKQSLGYLSTWPSGQGQPWVSTLNAPTAAVTANSAIVPAGTNGDISVFVSNKTDVVVDINGYFAPEAQGGGLSLYSLSPCRVQDTREPAGSQPIMGTLPVNVGSSSCKVPANAQAFVLNATVVPDGPLGFLSLWPAGEAQPWVSSLNAEDTAVTSNMAIVPTSNGSVDAYTSNPTHLILDISGYFAP